jgi:hypothetical protein
VYELLRALVALIHPNDDAAAERAHEAIGQHEAEHQALLGQRPAEAVPTTEADDPPPPPPAEGPADTATGA